MKVIIQLNKIEDRKISEKPQITQILSNDQKEILKGILQPMENSFMVQWKEVKETMIIDDILIFCESIERSFKNLNNITILNHWIDNLKNNIDLFELDKIENNLSDYPKLIKDLKTLLTN